MVRHIRYLLIALVFLASGCQSLLGPAATFLGVESEAGLPPGALDLDLDAPLPVDPSIRHGMLDNGLTYYVKQNREPENRAELWLAIDAGSVLEDEDQKGVAHFLEHMLFNGTEHFPEQALIDFFERVGMTFGPDINAYTSFDETVYQLRFPTDDPQIVETAFDVLTDWAARATLDPAEIDAERGVIVEEERLRDQNAGGRIRDQILPVVLGDSRYAERLPIGDMEIIRSVSAETIRRFYETWYRPDLMAVIAVGDFDAGEIETMIQERFADLPAAANGTPRPVFSVEGHDETRYLVVSDPEYPVSSVEISYKAATHEFQTAADYRHFIVQALFNYLFNFRLDELGRQADSPFIGAYYSRSNLVRPVDTISIGAQVRDEEILDGLEAVVTEVERIRRHGFTASELTRAKDALISSYRRTFNNRENRETASYAGEYLRNFLIDEPIPGIGVELALVEEFLPGITLDEVNVLVEDLVGEENRMVIVTAPQKAEIALPDEAALATVIETAQAKTVDPYVDIEVAGELVEEILPPVDVVATSTIAELDVTEIQLENGVRVLMKPTDFTQQVIFTAISPGGASLVSDEDYLEATFVGSILAESALGAYERAEINRLLTGKGVAVIPNIGELTESMSGAAPPDELDILFQLIYLYFTAPRADEAAFASFQNQVKAFLRNRDLTPSAALQDTLTRLRYGESVRYRLPTLAEVEAIDLEEALAIYQDRFADASDFTFVFVGDFSVDVLTRYAQTYLGNLPALDRDETWQNRLPALPTGVITENVYAGQEQQSIVQLLFSGPAQASYEQGLQLGALEGILDLLLREELRERRGAVYASFASANLEDLPEAVYDINIAFSSAPERAVELIEATFAIIQTLQDEGPTADAMEKVTAQMLREHEVALKENGFWLELLSQYAIDPTIEPRRILDFAQDVAAISAANIQQLAQATMPDDRYIEVVLYPEAMASETQ